MACNGAKKEMKKLLLVLVLLLVSVVCNSQIKIEVNNKGTFRAKEDCWKSLEITSSSKAMEFKESFAKAISSPDKKILVEEKEKDLKLKFLFKKRVEVKKNFIIYNSQAKTIDYLETTTIKEEKSYLILFIIASIALVIISNILFKKKNHSAAIIIAVLTPLLLFIALVFFTAISHSISFNFSISASVLTALFFIISSGDYKFYKISSIIFYIMMTVGMVILFI